MRHPVIEGYTKYKAFMHSGVTNNRLHKTLSECVKQAMKNMDAHHPSSVLCFSKIAASNPNPIKLKVLSFSLPTDTLQTKSQ